MLNTPVFETRHTCAQQDIMTGTEHTLATEGRAVLFLTKTRYRYSYAVHDMYTAERPQPDSYIPVGELYRRLRRSGLTEKNCGHGMLFENRHPTGKLSDDTALSGCAPKLHQERRIHCCMIVSTAWCTGIQARCNGQKQIQLIRCNSR